MKIMLETVYQLSKYMGHKRETRKDSDYYFRCRDYITHMHEKCCGSWYGLNTSIICNCMGHSKKLSGLAEVMEPEANTTGKTQPSKEAIQR